MAALCLACEQAQELHRLSSKPATDFNANRDQAVASGAGQLLVRLISFAAAT